MHFAKVKLHFHAIPPPLDKSAEHLTPLTTGCNNGIANHSKKQKKTAACNYSPQSPHREGLTFKVATPVTTPEGLRPPENWCTNIFHVLWPISATDDTDKLQRNTGTH